MLSAKILAEPSNVLPRNTNALSAKVYARRLHEYLAPMSACPLKLDDRYQGTAKVRPDQQGGTETFGDKRSCETECRLV